MAQSVEQVLAEAKLYSDTVDYRIVKLPPGAITAAAGVVAEIGEAFCALIVDKDEVSLIISADALNDFGKRLRGSSASEKAYRLITFDLALDLSLVGFLARVSKVLAEAQVSILPLAAYSRDHILVPADQFDIAMAALKKLKSDRA